VSEGWFGPAAAHTWPTGRQQGTATDPSRSWRRRRQGGQPARRHRLPRTLENFSRPPMKGMPSSTGGAEPRSTVCLSRRRHTASTRVDPTATATWAARGRAWMAATTACRWSAIVLMGSNPKRLATIRLGPGGLDRCNARCCKRWSAQANQMLRGTRSPLPAQQGHCCTCTAASSPHRSAIRRRL